MKIKNLYIILIAFVVFIINILVFFLMSEYVLTNPEFINQFMYYLAIMLIVFSGIASFIGYRDLNGLTAPQRIVAHIIFWMHLVGLAIFLGSVWNAFS